MLFIIIIVAHACFARKEPLRIYGGFDAQPDEYPFVVRMELQIVNNFTVTVIARHEHVCTASALSPEWLITAAHCIDWTHRGYRRTEKRPITVKIVIRYGHVENSPWLKDSFSDVLYSVKHPDFTATTFSDSKLVVKNDIALLNISPIHIKSYLKLSAVDYQTMYGHETIIAGFGITTKLNAEGKVETNTTLHLKKPLQLLKGLISKCSYVSPLVPALCLSSKCNAVTTACPGDSGGPVIHPSGIIGVLSLADITGYCNSPGEKEPIYTATMITPLGPYIEWIYSHVSFLKANRRRNLRFLKNEMI